jgi:hypothetical protein
MLPAWSELREAIDVKESGNKMESCGIIETLSAL